MKKTTAGLALALLFTAPIAPAAPSAVVEAVQYPAWLERGGNAVPLTPGTELRSADRLRTGGNARVELKLAEGSAVKLGENAQFIVERAEQKGFFRASLNVIAGAFRFTTSTLSKERRRDVSIKVKHVTAGIRGTDLWGKSTDAQDLVCLLEGKISVGAEGHPAVTLDSPLDFYVKKRDSAPVVSKVDADKVKQWSAETDMSAEGPVARQGGRWRVVAGTFATRDPALALNRSLRAGGYPAEVTGGEKGPFVVQVPKVAGEMEARTLMGNLRAFPGVALPSVQPMP